MSLIVKSKEYKETELGEFPSDWEIISFKDSLSKNKFKVGKIKQYDYKKIGKYPIIDQSKDFIAGFWDDPSDLYSGQLPVIIFGDHTRILKFIDFPFVCGADGTKIIVPDNKILFAKYLYFFLNTIKLRNRGYNRHYTLLKENKVLMPPLHEQKKIAHVLTAIQTSIQKSDHIINSYKELKKSMMKHLFTYGSASLEEAEKIKLKETDLGTINEEWDVKKLREHLLKTSQKDMRKENIEFKYVDVSSISRELLAIIGHTIYKGKKSPSRARKIIKSNDVIFATVRPTLKRIAKVTAEYDNEVCSTAFCVLRSDNNLDSDYLFYAMQRPSFIKELGNIERGANYPAVTDNNIKNQIIPLPDLETQKSIGDILIRIDEKIVKELNGQKSLELFFKSMLHNLMSAKVRVNNLEFENG